MVSQVVARVILDGCPKCSLGCCKTFAIACQVDARAIQGGCYGILSGF